MAVQEDRPAPEETTPLLSNGDSSDSAGPGASTTGDSEPAAGRWSSLATPESRLLLAGFLITTGLCFTQVPILYAFRKMACEDFYERAEPYTGSGDRCSRPEIDAGATRQIMILGMSTILCGILNLSITGAQIKNRGPKAALLINTFFPVLRVTQQAIGVGIGGRAGIIIMQCSQVFAIIGGPAGYLLTLNTSIAELVEPARRTASFGKLQGASMFGTALGFLLGGIVGEATIIRRPFEITAGLLTFCFIYCYLFVPYIDPKTMGSGDKKGSSASKKSSSFLQVLGPQTLRLVDGRKTRYYGLTLLATGGFIAGLAVGYAPVMTQLYSITVLGFTPTANSAFMFMSFSVRGVYLMFIFPQVVKWGRRWFAKSSPSTEREDAVTEETPVASGSLGPLEALPEAETTEPASVPKPVDEDAGAAFDLWFLRWSMLGDAIVTGCIGFASQPWHIFLAGALLPFFSGSDAASKGVLTELVPPAQRPDALQAITLVGFTAALATAGIFGSIFAAFVEMGKAYLTFFCNAAVAILAVLVLVLVRIPPKGSTVETDDEETEPELSTQDT